MSTLVGGVKTRLTHRHARTVAIAVTVALLSAPLLAQRHATPRSGSSGGGSGGGSSSHRAPSGGSSGGSRSSAPGPSSHSSGSASAAHRGGGSYGGGSYDGRSPHRPTGSVRHGGSHGGSHHHHGYYPYYNYYYPRFGFGFGFGYGYYSPYYYSPYYYPYYSGYYPYYGYGYGGYYGRPYGYYPSYGYRGAVDPNYYDRADLGAVALKVRPKTAEVYIDGRYVGTAGSFDGFPTYLWLEPGSYRLELVQDGYKNLVREIDVSPAQVLEFKLRLDEGVAARPEPLPDRDRAPRRDYDDYEGRPAYPPPREPRPEREEIERGSEVPRDAPRDRAELVLEVEPRDASVYLDGRFIGTGGEVSTAIDPLVVEAGEHRLQVVHPDFETEERTVTVRAGEERLIEVELDR